MSSRKVFLDKNDSHYVLLDDQNIAGRVIGLEVIKDDMPESFDQTDVVRKIKILLHGKFLFDDIVNVTVRGKNNFFISGNFEAKQCRLIWTGVQYETLLDFRPIKKRNFFR